MSMLSNLDLIRRVPLFSMLTHEQAQAVAISVGVDTGQGLLLWLQPLNEEGHAQGRLLCAWLQARAMPSKWHGFRCAVYSRPKTPVRLDKDLQERL